MRFLTADYLFPLHITPIKEGVLQISNEGEVIAIHKKRNKVPLNKLEIFDGILCPGFVNAHCHLELSHLKGIAEKGKGFLDFLATVQKRNEFSREQIQQAIEAAEQQMMKNGIVAVVDICNTSDTILQKQKGNLNYYNFIETFQLYEDKIEETINSAKLLRYAFRTKKLKATIIPHAPYSVPPKLMQKISESVDKKDMILCIHNQETNEENNLFEKKTGKLFNWLNRLDASKTIWEKRNKSSDIISELKNNNLMLVHNTFTTQEDVTNNYYCTCPKANLYIENALPDYSIFNIDKLCVGTDSLASNNSLSILEELFVIKENSNFDLNCLLKLASKNAAEVFGFKNLGTFKKGKTPGVNLLQNLDRLEILDRSYVKKLT